MLKNRITYITVIILLLLFQIAYTGYVAGMLLLMALVLPVFSWLISLPGALSTRIRVTAPDEIIRGEEAEVNITLRQSPLFLTGPVRGKLTMTDLSRHSSITSKISTSGGGLKIDTSHCSSYLCSLRRVRMYDLTGLIPLPTKKPEPFPISIMPIPAEPADHPDWTAGKNLVAKPFAGAAHPYELRDYRTGDTMRSIHWKKSAALDKTVVMDTMAPVKLMADIWIDWPDTGSGRDYVLDQIAWCIIYLNQNNAGANFKWFDKNNEEQNLYCNPGQLDKVIPALLTQPVGKRCSPDIVDANEIHLTSDHEGGGL